VRGAVDSVDPVRYLDGPASRPIGTDPGGTTVGNKVIHVEVTGKNGPALQKFYSSVFGWSLNTDNPGGYGMYRQDDGITGGIGADQNGGAGHVTFYVHADDPEQVLKDVATNGGQVIMPQTEVAPETKIALFTDPEGHVVGLM
jgi:predicted enzyme related to lactoylglutathione lyase